jgi:hypothetical protein
LAFVFSNIFIFLAWPSGLVLLLDKAILDDKGPEASISCCVEISHLIKMEEERRGEMRR